MNENETRDKIENLDELLSMRGKPFADWKEERKYLRDKWGMQGKELFLDSSEEKVEPTENIENTEK